jgi:hypothetical protein
MEIANPPGECTEPVSHNLVPTKQCLQRQWRYRVWAPQYSDGDLLPCLVGAALPKAVALAPPPVEKEDIASIVTCSRRWREIERSDNNFAVAAGGSSTLPVAYLCCVWRCKQ